MAVSEPPPSPWRHLRAGGLKEVTADWASVTARRRRRGRRAGSRHEYSQRRGAALRRPGWTRLARRTDRTTMVHPRTVAHAMNSRSHSTTRKTEWITMPMLFRSQVPHGLEIMAAVRLERDQGAGVGDARQGGHPAGDDIGQFLMAPNADHRHQ